MHELLPPLYAIADLDHDGEPLRFIEDLLCAGVELLQLRAKALSDEAFRRIAEQVIPLVKNRARVIINDRVELCLGIGADGVHLGQSDTPAQEARRVLGARALIGLSTHSLDDVSAANALAINYIGFGPVFRSTTKFGHAPEVGVEGVRAAVLQSKFPVVAIGGITPSKARELFLAGASSVAVISDLRNHRSATLAQRVREYYTAGAGKPA